METEIKTKNQRPIIVISTGDPGGIGPEITLEALKKMQRKRVRKNDPAIWDFLPLLIGDMAYFQSLIQDIKELFTVVHTKKRDEIIKAIPQVFKEGKALFWDMGNTFSHITIGKASLENGLVSYKYFEEGVHLVVEGVADGIVTAPLDKGSVNASGIPFAGHTEQFERIVLTQKELYHEPFMLMYSKEMRMLVLTTHIPVKDVEKTLNQSLSRKAILSTQEFLMRMEGKKPRIAMLAVDPHVGDRGAIGTIDARFSYPLLDQVRREGVQIEGPFAADGFLGQGGHRKYDLLVSAYHDQGLIPFKMASFHSGVNVTLNIPLKRTSPDHGTAYDLARTGRADSSSMIEAVRLCHNWILAERK